MVNELNNNEEIDNAAIQEPVEPIQETEQAEDVRGNGPKATEEISNKEEAEPVRAGEPNDGGDAEYVKHVQNWRALREAREKAEQERDEVVARLRQQDSNQNNGQGNNRQVQEERLTIGDDDLVEGKHFKQGQQQINNRIVQLEQQLIEAQIKATYPDFDKVVNKDTLGMLRDTDPDLAESLSYNPNLRSQAVAAYKAIKRYGLSGPDFSREKAKINTNSSKPRTVTSLSPQQGESPLSRANAFANGLTDELKTQLWQEMQDIVKNS